MSATPIARLRPLLVAAVLALLALPAVADAKKRDRDHDGMPDRWERAHHLSTHKKNAKRDPDKDGLRNRAEWRSRTNPHRVDSDRDGTPDAGEDRDRDRVDNGNEAREHTSPRRRDTDRDHIGDGREDRDHDGLRNAAEDASDTDPIDPDSDNDGVEDGDEMGGRVVAFDGTHLTVRLFSGAELSGTVDEATDIECEDAEGSGWDDHDETGNSGAPDCSADDIAVGDVVSEASIEVSADGTYFDSVDLAQ